MTASQTAEAFGGQDPVELLSKCPIFHAGDYADAVAVLRSNDLINPPYLFAGSHLDGSGLAERTIDDYIGGAFMFMDGDAHRSRRRLLNRLVRPAALDEFRDQVIAPQSDVVLRRLLATPSPDGKYRLELMEFSDRVFLHFAAKLVGLVGVETEEQVAELQDCVLPFNAANTSLFAQDRRAVLERADQAKRRYIEQFYEPARDAYREMLNEVKRGNLAEEDVPVSFMRFVVSGDHPDYGDEHLAIIESILLFVTSVGTSTQGITNTVNDLSTWFADHPEDYELRTDYTFLLHSMQESLRLWAPPTAYIMRQACRSTEVNGKNVLQGQELRIPVPLANRDPKIWGPTADEFNPRREVPEGMNRYGVAFGVGTHQCFGLRVVMGSDGTGGSHVRVLQKLFGAGVRPDPDNPPAAVEQNVELTKNSQTIRWMKYPVILEDWNPAASIDA
jgi:cytochrome P450